MQPKVMAEKGSMHAYEVIGGRKTRYQNSDGTTCIDMITERCNDKRLRYELKRSFNSFSAGTAHPFYFVLYNIISFQKLF